MITSFVQATGFVFELDSDGFYSLTFWVRLNGALAAETTTYSRLSWAEAVDTAGACALEARPGWAIGAGWQMQPLFGPGSDRD